MDLNQHTNVVRVRLRKPRRVFSFLCGDIHIGRGENCIVHSDRGPEWGICLLPPEPCSEEVGKRITMRVLRKVNYKDEQSFDNLLTEEVKARKICLEKIQQRKMDMKLVDVEVTFDRRKIIFYFTAEERVDFRELVRDLAHVLRSRIELRHIQVRDEAKMVGGLGCCGRELCCASWMQAFKPISMRMAKRQDLSLNPSKISGQCGRLLCCLSHENDMYEPPRRRSKKQEETVPERGEKVPDKPRHAAEAPEKPEPDQKQEEPPGKPDAKEPGRAAEKEKDGGEKDSGAQQPSARKRRSKKKRGKKKKRQGRTS
jgi:cell fate regulator YaaT (PSP1 superfamily)